MADIPEGITFGIALTGAVLGVINTWRAFDRDRIRLSVSPRIFFSSTGENGLCFEITNLGFLPVTLSQIGIDLWEPAGQFYAFIPRFLDSTRLPHRMEARTAVTAYLPAGSDNDPKLKSARRVFVKTACGRVFYGNSPAFKHHISRIP